MLERYPNSVKLLRAYASFLETVKNDPWASAKYYNMADEQEELQEIEANEGGPGGGGDDNKLGQFTPRGNAVITIDAVGTIQVWAGLVWTGCVG